jgi:hypothetical protein
MWAPRVAVTAALAGLFAWSFWQRWQLLAASPFPLGVDGYFYPIELRALLDRGALQYPASPLAFYLLAPFAALTDPITGTKLGAALLGAAIAAPAYAVGARLGGGRGAGLVAAVLATTSVGSTYLSVEFIKNGVGLTVALAALWLVLRATERPSRARIAAAIAGLACAYATHKMAAAVALLVAVPAALAAAGSRGVLRGRRLLTACAALVLVGVVAIALGAAFPERFLSARDASLARGLVSATPRWHAPALVFPTGELALGHDALLGVVLALVAVLARILRARRIRRAEHPHEIATPAASATPTAPAPVTAAAWPILVLAIAIGLPFLDVTERDGLGFRLRIAAFVPAALVAAIATRDVLARVVPAGWRDAALAALAVALAVARQPGPRLDGVVVTHPALVTAAQALSGRVPPGATLIIPERHIAFLVAWYTGAPIAIQPDHVPPSRRWRLLPLRFIGEGSALDRQLLAARAEPSLIAPLGVHPLHPNGLVLVAEPTWLWILERLPPADRARFAAWPTI